MLQDRGEIQFISNLSLLSFSFGCQRKLYSSKASLYLSYCEEYINIKSYQLLVIRAYKALYPTFVQGDYYQGFCLPSEKQANQCAARATQAPDHLTFLHFCTICSNQHHICCLVSPAPWRPRLLGKEVSVNIHCKQLWVQIYIYSLI